MPNVLWSNTIRGARFIEGTMPRIADSLTRIAAALEAAAESREEEIRIKALREALDLIEEHFVIGNPCAAVLEAHIDMLLLEKK